MRFTSNLSYMSIKLPKSPPVLRTGGLHDGCPLTLLFSAVLILYTRCFANECIWRERATLDTRVETEIVSSRRKSNRMPHFCAVFKVLMSNIFANCYSNSDFVEIQPRRIQFGFLLCIRKARFVQIVSLVSTLKRYFCFDIFVKRKLDITKFARKYRHVRRTRLFYRTPRIAGASGKRARVIPGFEAPNRRGYRTETAAAY